MSRRQTEHGTYRGYQQHTRYSTEPCGECREANRVYHESYRANRPNARAKDRWWSSTRARALEQLSTEYPARFLEILTKVRDENPAPDASALPAHGGHRGAVRRERVGCPQVGCR